MVKEVKTISEVTESFEQQHSVEFTIGSGGKWGAKVKVYGKTPDEALNEACKLIKTVEVILFEKNKNKKE